MGDEAAVVYQRERSPQTKSTIYLPQKQGVEDELADEVMTVDSPVILTPDDYNNTFGSLNNQTASGRRATAAATLGAAAKLYKCCECDYVSKRSYDVRRHMKTHGNTRPYGCPQCAHTARDAASLRAHMLQRHGNLDQYVCPTCDYSSNRQAELARHIKSYHDLV